MKYSIKVTDSAKGFFQNYVGTIELRNSDWDAEFADPMEECRQQAQMIFDLESAMNKSGKYRVHINEMVEEK